MNRRGGMCLRRYRTSGPREERRDEERRGGAAPDAGG